MEEKIEEFQPEDICVAISDECMGQGGYGKVRLGFHHSRGPVAVKCLSCNNEEEEKGIHTAIDNLPRMSHKNFVQIYGWAQGPESLAIIMEYAPGGTLKNALLDNAVDLSWYLRLRFISEIADGIAFLHNVSGNRRLVHSDIKPDNILLSSELHCKIAGFGGAASSACTWREWNKVSSIHPDKKPDNSECTSAYAAPEVLKDHPGEFATNQDVYSFGITVYVIVTREPSASPMEYPEKKAIDKTPDLAIINKLKECLKETDTQQLSILEFLEGEMNRCWYQNPTDKPSMKEVKDRLCKCLSEFDCHVIKQDADKARKSMKVKNPSPEAYQCVSLSKFSPPDSANSGDENHAFRKEKIEASIVLIQSSEQEKKQTSDEDLTNSPTPTNNDTKEEFGEDCKDPSRISGCGFDPLLPIRKIFFRSMIACLSDNHRGLLDTSPPPPYNATDKLHERFAVPYPKIYPRNVNLRETDETEHEERPPSFTNVIALHAQNLRLETKEPTEVTSKIPQSSGQTTSFLPPPHCPESSVVSEQVDLGSEEEEALLALKKRLSASMREIESSAVWHYNLMDMVDDTASDKPDKEDEYNVCPSGRCDGLYCSWLSFPTSYDFEHTLFQAVIVQIIIILSIWICSHLNYANPSRCDTLRPTRGRFGGAISRVIEAQRRKGMKNSLADKRRVQRMHRSWIRPKRSGDDVLRSLETSVRKSLNRVQKLNDEKRCKNCFETDADIMFTPCKHLSACVGCANTLTSCPACGQTVQKAIRIFRS